MSSIVKKLESKQLFRPPHDFVKDTVYEVIMGSTAYAVSNNSSDVDVYAVCVPDKSMVFPHLDGNIVGFGPSPKSFDVCQQHHIQNDGREYDISVYAIVKYFQLCSENNPNMIDSLFVPDRCVIHITDAGSHMRENRKMFLSKYAFNKLRGYAFSELKKLESYNPESGGKRAESFEKYGYDVKSAYHVVRLMLEAEMILNEGDLDLEINSEQLKFVRRGGYSLSELHEWFKSKEKDLSNLHSTSSLPAKSDHVKIRKLLWECLELHFGKIDNALRSDLSKLEEDLSKIRRILDNYGP